MKKVAAVIMHAPLGKSMGERLVEQGREASSRDLVTMLHRAGMERIFFITCDKEVACRLSRTEVRLLSLAKEEPFHFGKSLKQIIDKERLDGLLYFGSGSGGLLTTDRVAGLISFAQRAKRGALFNNFYSCDFAAIAGAKDLLGAALPQIDNSLGFVLSDLGFPCFALPCEVATQFDIDTPTDLLLLAAAEKGGEAMRAFLEEQRLAHPTIPPLIKRLVDRSAHVYLIGRINPATWAHFEREVACRTSGLIEGRGMRAYPNHEGILLQETLQEMGIHRFFKLLSRLADAAIIDTRPLLSKGGALPPAADRFASDLFRPELIDDSLWREFTREAKAASIPILLGGHSLVSGGLYLLAEACWKDHDLRRRLHPETIDWKKEPS